MSVSELEFKKSVRYDFAFIGFELKLASRFGEHRVKQNTHSGGKNVVSVVDKNDKKVVGG